MIYGLTPINNSGINEDLTIRVFNNTPLTDYRLFYRYEYDLEFKNVSFSNDIFDFSKNSSIAVIPSNDLNIQGRYLFYVANKSGTETGPRFPVQNHISFYISNFSEEYYDKYLNLLFNDSSKNHCNISENNYTCLYDYYQASQIHSYSREYARTNNDTYKGIVDNLMTSNWHSDSGSGSNSCDPVKNDFSCENIGSNELSFGIFRQSDIIKDIWKSYSYYPNMSIYNFGVNFSYNFPEDTYGDISNGQYNFNSTVTSREKEKTSLAYAKAYYYSGNNNFKKVFDYIVKDVGNESYYILDAYLWMYRATGNVSYKENFIVNFKELESQKDICEGINCTTREYSELINFYMNLHDLDDKFFMNYFGNINHSSDYIAQRRLFDIYVNQFNSIDSGCDMINDFSCINPKKQNFLRNIYSRMFNNIVTENIFYDVRILNNTFGEDLLFSVKLKGKIDNPVFVADFGTERKTFEVASSGVVKINYFKIGENSRFIEGFFEDDFQRYPKNNNLTFSISNFSGEFELIDLYLSNPLRFCEPFLDEPDYNCIKEYMQQRYIYSLNNIRNSTNYFLDIINQMTTKQLSDSLSTCDSNRGDFICNNTIIGFESEKYERSGDIRASNMILGEVSSYKRFNNITYLENAWKFMRKAFYNSKIWEGEFNYSDVSKVEDVGIILEGITELYEVSPNYELSQIINRFTEIAYEMLVNESFMDIPNKSKDILLLGLLKTLNYFSNESIDYQITDYLNNTKSRCINGFCNSAEYSRRLNLLWLAYKHYKFLDYFYLADNLLYTETNELEYCNPNKEELENNRFRCLSPYEQSLMIEAFSNAYENYVVLEVFNVSLEHTIIDEEYKRDIYDIATVQVVLRNFGNTNVSGKLQFSGSAEIYSISTETSVSTEANYTILYDENSIEIHNLSENFNLNVSVTLNLTKLGSNSFQSYFLVVRNNSFLYAYDDNYYLDVKLENDFLSSNFNYLNFNITNYNNSYLNNPTVEIRSNEFNVLSIFNSNWNNIYNNTISKNIVFINESHIIQSEINITSDKVDTVTVVVNSTYGGDKEYLFEIKTIAEKFTVEQNHSLYNNSELLIYKVVTAPIYTHQSISYKIENNKPFDILDVVFSYNTSVNIINSLFNLTQFGNGNHFRSIHQDIFAKDQLNEMEIDFYFNETHFEKYLAEGNENLSSEFKIDVQSGFFSDSYILYFVPHPFNIFVEQGEDDVYINLSSELNFNLTNEAFIDQHDLVLFFNSTNKNVSILNVNSKARILNFNSSYGEIYNVASSAMSGLNTRNNGYSYNLNLSNEKNFDSVYGMFNFSENIFDYYIEEALIYAFWDNNFISNDKLNVSLILLEDEETQLFVCSTETIQNNFSCDVSEYLRSTQGKDLDNISIIFNVSNTSEISNDGLGISLDYFNLNLSKYKVKEVINQSGIYAEIPVIKSGEIFSLSININSTTDEDFEINLSGESREKGKIHFGDYEVQVFKPEEAPQRKVFENKSGWKVFYESNDNYIEVLEVCSEDSFTYASTLDKNKECKINKGNDLVIWSRNDVDYLLAKRNLEIIEYENWRLEFYKGLNLTNVEECIEDSYFGFLQNNENICYFRYGNNLYIWLDDLSPDYLFYSGSKISQTVSSGGSGGGSKIIERQIDDFIIEYIIDSENILNAIKNDKVLEFLENSFKRDILLKDLNFIDENFKDSKVVFKFKTSDHIGLTYNVSVELFRTFGGFIILPLLDEYKNNIVFINNYRFFDDFVILEENSRFYFVGLTLSQLNNLEKKFSDLKVSYINDYMIEDLELIDDKKDDKDIEDYVDPEDKKIKESMIRYGYINLNNILLFIFYIFIFIFILFLFYFTTNKFISFSKYVYDRYQVNKNISIVKDKTKYHHNHPLNYDSDFDLILSLHVKIRYFQKLLNINKFEDARKQYLDIVEFINNNKDSFVKNKHKEKLANEYSILSSTRKKFIEILSENKKDLVTDKPKNVQLLDENNPEYDLFLKLKHVESDIYKYDLDVAKMALQKIEQKLSDLDERKNNEQIEFLKNNILILKEKISKVEKEFTYKFKTSLKQLKLSLFSISKEKSF